MVIPKHTHGGRKIGVASLRSSVDDDDALAAFGLDEADFRPPVASNGHGFLVTCAGCGKEFHSKRRSSTTRRSWCAECRAAGKPNVVHVAAFRARRGE